ncbi:MAG: AAA family ATPase [Nocardioidaceae bacterium]
MDLTPAATGDDTQLPDTTDPLDAEEAAINAANAFSDAVAREAWTLRVRQTARRRLVAEDAGNRPPPTPVDLTDFLAIDDPDPTYRIDRIWPTGGRILLAAQWKAGKSTMVGNLIRALADGKAFLDHFDITRTANILLIDDELDERLLRKWLAAQQIGTPEAVKLLTLKGRATTFDLLDPQTRAHWAHQITGADIVILDCLRPILDALSLDENHDAGQFLVAFDDLLNQAGITETIIVHHMGHSAERSRGDSRLMDWPDALWKIVRDKDEEDETADDPAGARYFSAYGRDVDIGQAELSYDPDTRHLTLGTGATSRRQATAHRKIVRTDESVMAVVTDTPGLTKRRLRAAVAHTGGHNPDIDAAVERLVAQGLILRQIIGQAHYHYPGTELTAHTTQPDKPGQTELPCPPVPTRAQLGAQPGVPVPYIEGTVVGTAPDAPAVPATGSGHTNPTTCPHHITGGNQPHPWLGDQLLCPQCATELEEGGS